MDRFAISDSNNHNQPNLSSKMVEDTLESRYAPVREILEEQLAEWFGRENFRIIVSGHHCKGVYCASRMIYFPDCHQQPPDDYAKWKIEVPTRLELVSSPPTSVEPG